MATILLQRGHDWGSAVCSIFPYFTHQLRRVARLEEHCVAAARRGKQHELFLFGPIHANAFSAGDAEPPGVIVEAAESVGAQGRLCDSLSVAIYLWSYSIIADGESRA